MLSQAISKNSLLLGLFAVVVAAALAVTELTTREKRAESLRIVKSKALEEVVPKILRDNVLLDDFINTDDQDLLQLKKPAKIHIARKNGKVTAFVLPTRTPDGYSGSIDSIVGINIAGEIIGVRVIKHMETPGLGDKIETKKSDWVFSFNGKSLENTPLSNWAVKKDRGEFDQFTGATISPRAVVKSVRNALEFYQSHKKSLMQQADSNQQPVEK